MNKLSHIAFIVLCISASVWFVRNGIESSDKTISTSLKPDTQEVSKAPNSRSIAQKKQAPPKSQAISFNQQISNLLEKQQFSAAVEKFNTVYDELDDSNINNIQSLFLKRAQHYLSKKQASLASQLMSEYLLSIQDEQAYILLSRSHVMQSNHRHAIDAAISAYGLSFDSERQENIENYIVQIALNYYAKKLNAQKQGRDSILEVVPVLTELHYLFPENAQLTFETARLLNATGNSATAQQYLSSLIYSNNDYSEAASNLLNSIVRQPENTITPQQPSNNPPPQRSSRPKTPPNSVIVPLRRHGSSYLVDVVINRKPVTLLLDTGASITALSEQVMNRLNLKKTSRKIRLSTANGTRTSNVFRADSVKLHNVELSQVAVVEVGLGQRSSIDGLLGTDILQQFNYQIDNPSNSLILSPR